MRQPCVFVFLIYYILFISPSSGNPVPEVAELQPRTCVNGPKSRQCWLPGFDINTNYYDKTPNTGVVREYWLKIQNTTIAPDGFKIQALTVNGTLPGPTLEANWGDTFLVHVENQMPANGTAIHFHGMRQYYTNQNDGVAGVTQCPIAPGASMTYTFRAGQYGTSWYHSHFSVQYGAGIQGPIVIHGPATANYDVDLGAITLDDWVHESVFGILIGTADAGHFPVMDDGLINGKNIFKYNKTNPAYVGDGTYYETTFVPGLKYRLRLINTAVQSYFRFTIDNHTFKVIANDFVPVVPYETDSIVLGEGQRFDIVVEATQPVENYWMRSIYFDAGFPYPVQRSIKGVIRYKGACTTELPTTTNRYTNPALNKNVTELLDVLTPHLRYNVGKPSLHTGANVNMDPEVFLWRLNGSSFLVDWTNPTIAEVYNGKELAPFFNKTKTEHNETAPSYNLPDGYNGTIYTSHNLWHIPQVNKWIYFILNNDNSGGDMHPIHIHGHDFWILSQGADHFNPSTGKLNLDNPSRRDVSTLLSGGHLVFAFYSDNPGIWMLHCHIAWHVSEGFALQFLERRSEILQTYDHKTFQQVCKQWDRYIKHEKYGEDDSGV